jgi:hypothetical protein
MSNHTLRASGFLGSEFNAFLFESIGVDRYGRPLSVVSALARLDLDAWAEAAKLARLPRDLAADKLSAFIRRCTELPQAMKDSRKIAERLVELLPDRAVLPRRTMATTLSPEQAAKLVRSTAMSILFVFAAVVIGLQLLAPHACLPISPPTAPTIVAAPALIPYVAHQ